MAALGYLMSGADSCVLNCGYGRGHSVLDVIAAVREVAGVDIDARETARRPGDVAQLVCASKRIREQLSWSPKHDRLATMVRTAYEWECRLRDGTAFVKRPGSRLPRG